MHRRTQRGGVMVQALVLIAALIGLMGTLAANQHITLTATQNQRREQRAEVAAKSGLARARAVLAAVNTNLVTKNDDWATLGGTKGSEAYRLDDTTTFRMEVVDAGALVNVNLATEPQLQTLPIEPELVSSLLDWREGSLAPRADGAKDEYYNQLETPYNTRLGSLHTLSELLLVRDWTAQQLYQPQTEVVSTGVQLEDERGNPLPLASLLTVTNGAPNTDATGASRVNWNQANINPALLIALGLPPAVATQLARQAPFTSFQQLLALPGLSPNATQQLLETATFTGGTRLQGKINLNTATEAVLQTVPGVTADIAQGIVAQQGTGFQSLGDLTLVPGASGAVLAQIADAFCVGSDTWIVRIWGESGGIGTAVEAVIGVRNGQAKVVSFERLATTTIPTWWGWDEEASTEI